MQRQALELHRNFHFNSIFQIEYHHPLEIRKGSRSKFASGCYIASTFFHNTPPSSKVIGNSTVLEFQTQRTGRVLTTRAERGSHQSIDPTALSEANNEDRIAETLKQTTLIGCTYEPKLEIYTFKVVDEATGAGRVGNVQSGRISSPQKLNLILTRMVRMQLQRGMTLVLKTKSQSL